MSSAMYGLPNTYGSGYNPASPSLSICVSPFLLVLKSETKVIINERTTLRYCGSLPLKTYFPYLEFSRLAIHQPSTTSLAVVEILKPYPFFVQ